MSRCQSFVVLIMNFEQSRYNIYQINLLPGQHLLAQTSNNRNNKKGVKYVQS